MRLSRCALHTSFVVLAAFVPLASGADVSTTLTTSAGYVRDRNYNRAISDTELLLDGLALDTVEEIIEAHKILGVAYCETGNRSKALNHFRALLAFSPRERINDLPRSRPCRVLLESLRPRSAGPKDVAEAETAPEDPDDILSPSEIPVVASAVDSPLGLIESPKGAETSILDTPGPSWHLFVPFGVGQFRNEQRTKGIFFLTAQSAAVVTGIATAIMFHAERNSEGTFSDPSHASTLRAASFISLASGGGLAILGIVDALIVNRRKARERGSFELALDTRGLTFSAGF